MEKKQKKGGREFRELTSEQVQRFHERGFLGPMRIWSEEKMEKYRKYVANETLQRDNGIENVPDEYYRHVDDPIVFEMATKQSILDMLVDLYGPDLLLWSTRFWNKVPGHAAIPWHQHYHHLPVRPQMSVTAWIGLTEATEENGCLRIIPGSHTEVLPQVESPEDKSFDKMTDPEYVDEEKAVSLELDPGEVILFTERTLHESWKNTTDSPRAALSARYTLPHVHVDSSSVGDPDESTVIPVEGTNWARVNETTTPPDSRSR